MCPKAVKAFRSYSETLQEAKTPTVAVKIR